MNEAEIIAELRKPEEYAMNNGVTAYRKAEQYKLCAADLIESLRTQLSESQRREKAAVEDMKVMALVMRESEEISEGCCFACKHDAQNLPGDVILAYGECPGYECSNCFEWRGLQEAEKGCEK